MANLDQIQLPDNTTYDIISKTGRGLVRATMNNTTSTSTAFVVEASGISALYDGLTIVVKNTKVASASGCTLQLNDLAAKGIWLSQSNSACTTHWALNAAHIFIYDATNERWELQQGRDTNSNTWRSIQVNGTQLLGTGTSTGAVNFKSGTNCTVSGSGNNITFTATDTTYSDATTSASGLMSASDKTKLNEIPTKGYSDWAYVSPSDVTNINGSAGN